MKNWFQRRFINFLVRGLFNTISKDDILRVERQPIGVKVFIGSKELPKDNVLKLKQDAQVFEESVIWKILSNELKHQANLRMFEKSKTVEDIVAGKMLLYLVDVVEMKIAELKNL